MITVFDMALAVLENAMETSGKVPNLVMSAHPAFEALSGSTSYYHGRQFEVRFCRYLDPEVIYAIDTKTPEEMVADFMRVGG